MIRGSKYHVFSHLGRNYLFIRDFKQLFEINRGEYIKLLGSRDNLELFERYNKPLSMNNQFSLVDKDTLFHQFCIYICPVNGCNSDCIYCFAGSGEYGKKCGFMSDKVCDEVVDFVLKTMPPNKECNIIFFGGEPLMAYPKIIKITESFKQNAGNQMDMIRFNVVTNATLLNREMIDYFVRNNFGFTISIDGDEHIQTRQRPLKNGQNSYKEATKNLPYLFSKTDLVHARATYFDFDQDLFSIYLQLSALGFNEVQVVPDFLYIKDFNDFDKLIFQMDTLLNRILEYVKNSDNFPFGIIAIALRNLFFPPYTFGSGCGAGHMLHAVDIQGNLYPCHRFISKSQYCEGNVANLNDILLKENLCEICSSKCKDCWNKYSCAHGCLFNELFSEDLRENTTYYMCEYAKKLTEIALVLCANLPDEKLKSIMGI